MFVAKPVAEQAGFKFWKPLIWDKKHIGMGYHYRARYEVILFFEKGKRKLHNLGVADVLTAPRIWRGYPTEKPVTLATTLVEQSSSTGESVLDPFCGSGSFGVAAVSAGRNFLGADTSPSAIEITTARLKKAGALYEMWPTSQRALEL
jgi:site-specific DNA-methyltransferase (adenine-specific)